MKPLLQISATRTGVREVAIRCGEQEGVRLYAALCPVIQAINKIVGRVMAETVEAEGADG